MADGDWKPSGRPQSTIARNFSASLHDVFDIDNNLGGLTASVEEKKKAVDSQTKELEALEARLKETENRLKERQSRNSSPAGRDSDRHSPHRRQPLPETFNGNENNRYQPSYSSPLAPSTPQSTTKQPPLNARSQREAPQYEPYRQTPTGYRKPVGQN